MYENGFCGTVVFFCFELKANVVEENEESVLEMPEAKIVN